MRRVLREEGLEDSVEVDSAGTGGWHVGAPPDERATEAAAPARASSLDGAARKFDPGDFERFDLILAMDGENRRDLLALAPDERGAGEGADAARVRPLGDSGDLDVPDPYYGGDDGFEQVLDLVERAVRGLIGELRARDRG